MQIIQKIGENIKISNYQIIEGNISNMSSYIHSDGRLASLVLLATSNDNLGKDIAMQVAANNPLAISPDDIDVAIMIKKKKLPWLHLRMRINQKKSKKKLFLEN